MANNTKINTGKGGVTLRTIDRSGVKTHVATIDAGGSTSETLVQAAGPASATTVAIPTQDLKDSGRNTVNYFTMLPYGASVGTVPVAATAVVTWNGHGLVEGQPFQFTATTLPTTTTPAALVAGATYYVRNPAANTFNFSDTPTGTLYNSTAAGTAVSVYATSAGSSVDAALPLYKFASNANTARSYAPAVITSGKTYRITAISMTFTPNSTTAYTGRLSLRYNSSGTASSSSPAVAQWILGGSAAVVGAGMNTVHVPLHDGLELAGGGGICVTWQAYTSTGAATSDGTTAAPTPKINVTIIGYEY